MSTAQAKFNETAVVNSAEGAVIDARMADLVEAHRAARARWSAAKGLLTRAMKDGSAEKIAAAHQREQGAYAEFDRIGRASIKEMFALNGARLDNLGRLLDQFQV